MHDISWIDPKRRRLAAERPGRTSGPGSRGRRRRRAAAALVAAGALLVAASGDDEGARTRAVMDPIFDAITTILPLSLNAQRFQEPAHRAAISESLGVLHRNASKLAAHGVDRDASFAFLSRSLARDARDLEQTYDQGRYDEARFRFHEMIETCIACHSRLPSNREFPLGQRFVGSVGVKSLPLDERVRLELATRQFDDALATYEELFASPDALPVDFDLMGNLDEYLEISIRVKGDLDRPIRTLELLSQRPDTPQGLREDLRSWVLSLRQIRARSFEPPTLEEARFQLREAEGFDPQEDDRRALIHYLVASSVLHRFIAEESASEPVGKRRAQQAEAYYLLGLIESRIGRALWPWQAEYLLETAIRMEPGTPLARDAYALLEEFVAAGYSGSGGLQIPMDEQMRLRELEVLSREPGARSGTGGEMP